MNLRHILEYEDLMVDLEGIGAASKRTYSLWVSLPRFMGSTGYTTKPSVLVALGNPFWTNGSLEADMGQILDSLRRGDFTRPDLPQLDWKALGGHPIGSYSPEDPEPRRRAKDTIKFLDLPSLKTFLGSSRFSLGKTLDGLREETMDRLHPESREVSNVGVVLVYANPGDEDLLIAPTGSLYQASTGGQRVIIEDLTDSDNYRTYLKDLM